MKMLLSAALVLLFACGEDRRTADPVPATDAGLTDTGEMLDSGMTAADVAVDPGTAVDAGPVIPPEILEICRRNGLEGYDQACDVEAHLITVPTELPAPPRMQLFPGIDQFNMNGWEWWQKWPGGHSPTMEYTEATDPAIRCSVASALRFAAIMQDPPEDLLTLLGPTSTWEGRFYNWNDDYSQPAAVGDGTGALLWAWMDHLIKWISQTNNDGSCYLPTRSLLVEAAANCLSTANSAGGHIEGCEARP